MAGINGIKGNGKIAERPLSVVNEVIAVEESWPKEKLILTVIPLSPTMFGAMQDNILFHLRRTRQKRTCLR
jgi:hypothetical protein